ncbi:DUF6515 family protein [Microbulbifer bruguierae]|uniref:DUF6515 family protein n=1 Tax=Microbulbifer bruguierae TaxID=3029061 RepID=A0ABY8NB96_9GAMM|nr:DUF6515 family protein [Microbulbifer bruguierae]WGL15679.1 DUF6515 family protein [Microbulbifer bruguierae]
MKKAVKYLFFGAGLVALLSFAFAAPADARGYHHGHHHGHGHWGPRFRGPRIGIGLSFPVLPAGFVSLGVGGVPYYYQGGHYYRPAPAGYVVVDAPLGAAVLTLPASAMQVQIGGFTYYQYGNAFYQWQPHMHRYVVVPAPAPTMVATAAPAAPVAGATQPAYTPGQVVENLPVGYTAEIINGIQYYRYGGHYFMPTQRDGHEVYVVVQV